AREPRLGKRAREAARGRAVAASPAEPGSPGAAQVLVRQAAVAGGLAPIRVVAALVQDGDHHRSLVWRVHAHLRAQERAQPSAALHLLTGAGLAHLVDEEGD